MSQHAKPVSQAFGLATLGWAQFSVDVQCTGPYRLCNLESLTSLLMTSRYGIVCVMAFAHEAHVLSSGGPRKGANSPSSSELSRIGLV